MAIVCELCGSNNIVKQDGMFVCQQCGTKYTLEEARKMMGVTGETAVSAPAPVAPAAPAAPAQNDELKNLYAIARRAKDDNNSESAARYYDMILPKDPMSWEASFYVTYFKAMQCKIAHIRSAAISVTNCLDTVMALIRDHVAETADQEKAVLEVSTACVRISNMLYNAAQNHYNGIGDSIRHKYLQEMLDNCCAARDIVYTLGNQIDKFFPGNETLLKAACIAWKAGITKHVGLLNYFANRELNVTNINNYVEKVKRGEPEYVGPDTTPPAAPSGGCYVATCVYGSYDCPEVWTLRRYRDDTLASTWYGRAFIHTYYAVSPTIVRLFGETRWFKNLWRGKLDSMVRNLQAKGVESTPYNDRQW